MEENVVNRYDAGMIERGGQLRFTQERRLQHGAGSLGRNDLDGDIAFETSVARLIDDSHAPGSDVLFNPVGPQQGPDRELFRAHAALFKDCRAVGEAGGNCVVRSGSGIRE